MILKLSENQPSQMYISKLFQIWYPVFLVQFLKGSYLGLTKSAQNAI